MKSLVLYQVIFSKLKPNTYSNNAGITTEDSESSEDMGDKWK